MSGKIIIIEGYLASGKSTFARKLSKETKVPCFIKDTFKIALSKSAGSLSREESSKFSAVTFDGIMYAAERLIETGNPVIIEGNFTPAGIKKTDEAGEIRRLIEKYGCSALTFKFTGSTRVLFQRFVNREGSPERGQANTMQIPFSYEDFSVWCHNLDNFDVGGEIIRVDTTDFDTVDFDMHTALAGKFLQE